MDQSSNTNNGIAYVIITPARNEETYIERTIQSVVNQTILPKRWVIVSDGSTDRTDGIVDSYLAQHPWMELVRMPEHRDRQFAAKVVCFNAGYERVKDLDYTIIGNLDADISFEKNYFEFLVGKFLEIPGLGVAGTPFVEEDNYNSASDSFEGEAHVAGGCQLFRRECFEEIGGYIPVKGGGIDWIAVTTARMKGWKTRSFREKSFFHYRKLGTGDSTEKDSVISYGKKDYYLGGHPFWILLRILYRMMSKPYIIGGLYHLYGYLSALFSSTKRPVSDELMRFHRKEQMKKLKLILLSALKLKKIDKFRISSEIS
jgi:glycosyltransferase involved in cell wall biosynthesis